MLLLRAMSQRAGAAQIGPGAALRDERLENVAEGAIPEQHRLLDHPPVLR